MCVMTIIGLVLFSADIPFGCLVACCTCVGKASLWFMEIHAMKHLVNDCGVHTSILNFKDQVSAITPLMIRC